MNRDEVLFYEALERGNSQAAAAYLDDACAGDHSLRQRVERLLVAHGGRDSLLDQPAGGALATCDISPAIAECGGQQIGPYKLIQQIGEGGMGVVYMAQQTEPVKRLVALKIIKPGMDSRQVIARFEAERQALALMDHPNIARVLDGGTTGPSTKSQASSIKQIRNTKSKALDEPESPVSDIGRSDLDIVCDLELGHCDLTAGRPYFVMELVKGIPITAYCDEKKLTPKERLELFIPVCLAVQHAHQKGIIHRDLKPSNVLIALYDGAAVPKVIDFGVAKATGAQLTEKTLVTNFGSLVGTVEYMSPEQAELNQLDVDTRSDIYALGVLLYELLTGETPLDRQHLKTVAFGEMLRLIREEEAETVSARIARTRTEKLGVGAGARLSRRAHAATYELDWIVAKALEKDRGRRYESAAAFAADIQRYLSDEPVHACPPTAMYRFQKFARKHKPALVTAAAIALCLLLGTTVSAWQAVRATAAEALANVNEAQAQASAKKADEKAQEATKERDEAQKQRDEVKALADKLAAKEQQLQRHLYASNMHLAHSAWQINGGGGIGAAGFRRMNELLERHRPQPGEADLRGFEWHYLNRLSHPELLTLKGRIGWFFTDRCLAFSPDGTKLAFGHTNWNETKSAFGTGDVKVWDARTGQELLVCKGHALQINSVAFTPDGKRLASASDDGTLKVWDSQSGQELLNSESRTGAVKSVTYSPDGKRMASASTGYTTPERKWVAPEITIRDAATGEVLVTCKGHAEKIWSVAFSPDGQRLASGSNDELLKVWNAQTGEEVLSIKAHYSQVASVVFSPDGKRIYSGGGWLTNLPGLRAWDAQTGQEIASFKQVTGQVDSVALSPDGKRLVTNRLRVWDAETGNELASFKGHTGEVYSAVFNHDGTRLASAGNDGTVRIWDASVKQEPSAFSKAATNVKGVGFLKGVGFTPDGQRVMSAVRDPMTSERAIKLWDAHRGQELLTINPPAGKTLYRATISPDGKRVAAGFGYAWEKQPSPERSAVAMVWDVETGRELVTFKGHTWPVVDVAVSPDSTRVASCSSRPNGMGSDDQGKPCEVKVWDANSGEELLAIKGHKSFVNSVTFSPDGKRLATISRDKTAKVWDAQSGQELLSVPADVGMGGSVAFSPDGKRLASSHSPWYHYNARQADEIKLWDIQTGQELRTFQGHTSEVSTLVFSPDGKRLASTTGRSAGPSGQQVKLWDAETGEELLSFDNIGSGGVAFSPDGHRLISGGPEGLKIFDATPLPTP